MIVNATRDSIITYKYFLIKLKIMSFLATKIFKKNKLNV
jgi:hypothetical protein